MTTLEEAISDLAASGSAEAAARIIEAAGVKGIRGSDDECPAARYLAKVTGLPAVSVAITAVALNADHRLEGSGVELPQVVQDLVEQIDRGMHPSLVEAPPPEPEPEP